MSGDELLRQPARRAGLVDPNRGVVDDAVGVGLVAGDVDNATPPAGPEPLEHHRPVVEDDLQPLSGLRLVVNPKDATHGEGNVRRLRPRAEDVPADLSYDRVMHKVAHAAAVLESAERILVFTGAGISTESGIPDFRGPNGVWKRVDPKKFTLRHYVTNREFRKERWASRFGGERPDHVPNAAHHAVADLWRSGRMVGCITQNIDGLHVAGGLPESAIAEVHGNPRGIMCIERGHRLEVAETKRRWEQGDEDPRCHCGSILKSTVVMFGEQLPYSAVGLAERFSREADAAIAVGSTISVFPAAEYVLAVADRRCPFVILNMGPTEADRLATVRLEGKAGELLPCLVTAVVAQRG